MFLLTVATGESGVRLGGETGKFRGDWSNSATRWNS